MSDKLSEEEFYELLDKIGKPTYSFLLKRINKEILKNEKYKSIDANSFFNLLVACMATLDTNMIRWMQCFNKIKTNSELDQQKIVIAFLNQLSNSLKTVVQ